MLHPLTQKIIELAEPFFENEGKGKINKWKVWNNDDADKIIREWLEEKICSLSNGEKERVIYRKLLGLTLPPIEVRVAEAMEKKFEDTGVVKFKDLAKIVVAMVREEK